MEWSQGKEERESEMSILELYEGSWKKIERREEAQELEANSKI
jgi:hypothetical protein